MTQHVTIAISRHSAGARAFAEALQRAGYTTNYSTLLDIPETLNSRSHAAGPQSGPLHIDRCLPPYPAPIRAWTHTWWNRPDHSWHAWSKIHTAHTSNQHHLPHPRTITLDAHAHHSDPRTGNPLAQAQTILEHLGGKAVVKPDRGLMGDGVALLTTPGETLEALQSTGQGVLQEYIPEASTTLRIVCARHTVISAYTRTSASGDWRGNVAAGATVSPTTLDTQDEQLALRALRAFNLDFAGIDVIRTNTGPLLLEVNPAFGVAGLLSLQPRALDELIDVLRHDHNACTCGSSTPHDSWAC